MPYLLIAFIIIGIILLFLFLFFTIRRRDPGEELFFVEFCSSCSEEERRRYREEVSRRGTIVKEYSRSLDGVAVRSRSRKLEDLPTVCGSKATVFKDLQVTAKGSFQPPLPPQQASWAISRIGADVSSTKSGDGEGAVDADVYVLDTGVQRDHTDLNVVESLSFISNDPEDRNGHGTHVAGIIGAKDDSKGVVGVAPGCRVHSFKVLNNSGAGSITGILDALEELVRRQESSQIIANMSFGAEEERTNTIFDRAIDNAAQAGVLMITSAGNSGTSTKNTVPARAPGAMAVGAYNREDVFASFSNFGPEVDILAPGVDIRSTFFRNTLQRLSGTSMATPMVTGVAVLLFSNEKLARKDLLSRILEAAREAAESGKNKRIKSTPQNTTDVSVWAGAF